MPSIAVQPSVWFFKPGRASIQAAMLSSMPIYEFDQFHFDPADGRLAGRAGSGDVHLRPQAGKLLLGLLAQPQTVVDRDTLVAEIWGRDTIVDFESGLAALLRELRQAIQSLGGDPALIETVPRRGYRLRAEVRRIENRSGETKGPGGRWKRNAAVAVGVVIVAALAAAAWWRSGAGPDKLPDRPHQLAILPLDRFGDPDYPPDQAGIRLADGILAALWRADLERLELIGRAGMRPYDGREDVVSAVAADLGVDLLIEGSIRFASDGWQVDLRLLQVPPGRVVWSHTLEGKEPTLPTAAVAAELVGRLAEAWPEIHKQLIQR